MRIHCITLCELVYAKSSCWMDSHGELSVEKTLSVDEYIRALSGGCGPLIHKDLMVKW